MWQVSFGGMWKIGHQWTVHNNQNIVHVRLMLRGFHSYYGLKSFQWEPQSVMNDLKVDKNGKYILTRYIPCTLHFLKCSRMRCGVLSSMRPDWQSKYTDKATELPHIRNFMRNVDVISVALSSNQQNFTVFLWDHDDVRCPTVSHTISMSNLRSSTKRFWVGAYWPLVSPSDKGWGMFRVHAGILP
jgi:hypothetical protein